jgi:23S rRNA (uracil1939-C5)-methyltransferase
MKRGADKGDARAVVEAAIVELAPGGDGVAIVEERGERRAVFVRGAAVGDRVRARVDFGSRPARGTIESLLAPSPDRVEPACAWAAECGACDWMHVSAPAQLRTHEAHLAAALPEAYRGAPIALHPAPRALGYRTRARVHVRSSGGRAIVGMNEVGTNEPVEVERCAVLHPDLEAARARIAGLFEGAHGRGDVQLALGRLDASPRPVAIEARWSGVLPGACYARVEKAVNEGWLAGASLYTGETKRPARVGDPTPWIQGGDGVPLRLGPGGFGQASDEGNVALASRVAELAALACEGKAEPRILELYAGAGNFTVLLAKIAKHVVAVESSEEGCAAARTNLAARGIEGVKFTTGDAAVYAIPRGLQLVVLDPPRRGAREVAAALAASKAAHVVYVSCDAQTLARDLALLAPAYALKSVDLFELFPQTSHVEAVLHLARVKA